MTRMRLQEDLNLRMSNNGHFNDTEYLTLTNIAAAVSEGVMMEIKQNIFSESTKQRRKSSSSRHPRTEPTTNRNPEFAYIFIRTRTVHRLTSLS